MTQTKTNVNEQPGLPWSVNLWGSHPNAGNDDCHTGFNFATEAEARECFANPWDAKWFQHPASDSRFPEGQTADQRALSFWSYYQDSSAFFELDGPDLPEVEIRANPDYDAQKMARRARQYENEARREQAMQAGMGLGIHAYNEHMGYE